MRSKRWLKRLLITWLLGVIILLVITARAVTVFLSFYGSSEPPPEGWRVVRDLPGTRCAHDTPYQLLHRDAPGETLTIYFQAGGACWDGATCLEASPSFDQTALDGEVNEYRGVFDFGHSDNPLRDDDIVFIPYCTADVHLGDAVIDYPSILGRTITIHHQGYRNVTAALNWIFRTYPNPERVLITGSSAGAIASIFYAERIMRHYTEAPIVQFADGYVGVAPAGWPALGVWNVYAHIPDLPGLQPFDPQTFSVTQLYQAAAEAFPQHTFSQFTHAADPLQMTYYLLTGGDPTHWISERDRMLDSLTQLPNFRSFVGAGVFHTILFSDEVYAMAIQDVRLIDWLAALIGGERDQAASLHCARGTLDCP
ncbi:hypothetical protein FBR02_13820 [Anaerolineae bacterium CFX9]|nr:hypothetical protein [Anaerolineae bacterium CFX9]